MGSIVLKSLSVLLGVFFIFVGITKLSPLVSKELHKDLVSIDVARRVNSRIDYYTYI